MTAGRLLVHAQLLSVRYACWRDAQCSKRARLSANISGFAATESVTGAFATTKRAATLSSSVGRGSRRSS
jgi:hypothetical protein